MTDPEIQALLIANQGLADQVEADGEQIEELEKQNSSLLKDKNRLEAERELLVFWLLRVYQTLTSKDAETLTTEEAAQSLAIVLANFGYDPKKSPKAAELLKQPSKYYV
jgi:hypothetical protein